MTPAEKIQAFLDQVKQHDEAATKGPWAWQKFGDDWNLTGQWGMRPIILATLKGKITSLREGLLVPFDPQHPDARLLALSRTALPKAGKALGTATKRLVQYSIDIDPTIKNVALACLEEIARILEEGA